jgi:hypothetical protein
LGRDEAVSGIKHGNPVYSELGFPSLGRAGSYLISTGSVKDLFARGFSDALLAYATYQLVWAAQATNKLIAQYAIVDIECRRQIQSQYLAQKKVEPAFRRYLKRKILKRPTFFGIKARVRRSAKAAAAPVPSINS